MTLADLDPGFGTEGPSVDAANASLKDALAHLISRPGAEHKLALDSPNLEQDLARLVLTVIELVRRLLESQALHRMERGTLSEQEIDRVGDTLMRAEDQIAVIAASFGLRMEDLNLDLGPLGRLF